MVSLKRDGNQNAIQQSFIRKMFFHAFSFIFLSFYLIQENEKMMKESAQ